MSNRSAQQQSLIYNRNCSFQFYQLFQYSLMLNLRAISLDLLFSTIIGFFYKNQFSSNQYEQWNNRLQNQSCDNDADEFHQYSSLNLLISQASLQITSENEKLLSDCSYLNTNSFNYNLNILKQLNQSY